jgi:hypothetical protein
LPKPKQAVRLCGPLWLGHALRFDD